ncbi:TPA: hypothetical protein ACKRXP_000237 [Proteus mirabilis]|uniref:hypothetical protein n=1 Tax=Proteus mirabilis TaxID=584 RepID=UPI0013791E17|nr:hypothetical protein [Proteus mirabilis]MBI6334977.1 hypothetical protein [Proteus mirabilis]
MTNHDPLCESGYVTPSSTPIPKLTVFGLRIFQRVLLKSELPVYLWLLAFDGCNLSQW